MGNPFTSLITKMLPNPNDPGQSFTIRKLNPKQAHEAQQAAHAEFVAALKETLAGLTGGEGGVAQAVIAGMMQSATPKGDEGAEPAPKAPKRGRPPKQPAPDVPEPLKGDPLDGYDRFMLIKHGVVAWSYDLDKTDENICELDEETQEWLAREVLRLAKPALFQTPVEAEAAEKKGSGSSPSVERGGADHDGTVAEAHL